MTKKRWLNLTLSDDWIKKTENLSNLTEIVWVWPNLTFTVLLSKSNVYITLQFTVLANSVILHVSAIQFSHLTWSNLVIYFRHLNNRRFILYLVFEICKHICDGIFWLWQLWQLLLLMTMTRHFWRTDWQLLSLHISLVRSKILGPKICFLRFWPTAVAKLIAACG